MLSLSLSPLSHSTHCAHHKSHFSASVSSVQWPFAFVSLRFTKAKITLIKPFLDNRFNSILTLDALRQCKILTWPSFQWQQVRNCCQINCSSVKQFSNYKPQKSHSKFPCPQLSLLYSHRFHSAHISLEPKSKLPRCVARSLELSKLRALSARIECGTFALLLSDVKSRLLLLLCLLLLLSCPLASFVAYNCLRF